MESVSIRASRGREVTRVTVLFPPPSEYVFKDVVGCNVKPRRDTLGEERRENVSKIDVDRLPL